MNKILANTHSWWQAWRSSSHKGPVRNLGGIFDCNLTMEAQVNNMAMSASPHLHNTGCLHKRKTVEITKCMVQSLVIFRLDYCNSLRFPSVQFQWIHNSAAHLITRTKSCEHVTLIPMNLHFPSEPVFNTRCSFWSSRPCMAWPQITSNSLPNHHVHCIQPKKSCLWYPELASPEQMAGFSAYKHLICGIWYQWQSEMQNTISYFKTALNTHLFQTAYHWYLV